MEIIKRKSRTEKESDNRSIQVSYNSHGHLMIRIFDRNAKETKREPIKDTIIVFTALESQTIIRFIQQQLVARRNPYDC